VYPASVTLLVVVCLHVFIYFMVYMTFKMAASRFGFIVSIMAIFRVMLLINYNLCSELRYL